MGKEFIAGRVEERNSEDSVVIFFIRDGKQWIPDDKTAQFNLQDPFITRIDNEVVFGGVKTNQDR